MRVVAMVCLQWLFIEVGLVTVHSQEVDLEAATAITRPTADASLGGELEITLPAVKLSPDARDAYYLFARRRPGEGLVFGINVSLYQAAHPGEAEELDQDESFYRHEILAGAMLGGVEMKVTSGDRTVKFAVTNALFSTLVGAVEKWGLDLPEGLKNLTGGAGQSPAVSARNRTRELYVEVYENLAPEIREAILAGRIVLQMKPGDVRISWGNPDKIYRSVDEAGIREQWLYGETYLFFENGLLKSWQESE